LEDDISYVNEAYSHHQALSQTDQYLRKKNISPKPFGDTAGAARMISEKQKR
jgi:prephenate dehydratase